MKFYNVVNVNKDKLIIGANLILKRDIYYIYEQEIFFHE